MARGDGTLMGRFKDGFRTGYRQAQPKRPRRDPYSKGYRWGMKIGQNLVLIMYLGMVAIILTIGLVWVIVTGTS